MIRKIGLIYPETVSGGVRTAVDKLYYALKFDGFEVYRYSWSTTGLIEAIRDDLNIGKQLKRLGVDAAIYSGSIALLSYTYLEVPTAIFIHGLIKYEAIDALLHKQSSLTQKAKYLALLLWPELVNKRIKPSFFISPCKSTCEVNGIKEKYIILPLFILEDEVRSITANKDEKRDNQVVVYTSFVRSPKLLDLSMILRLFRIIDKKIKRKIYVYIVSPIAESNNVAISYDNICIKVIKGLPRKKFMKLLGSSLLYIDTLIDEELRFSTLEAGLQETAVAKLIHPRYIKNADYSEKEIIIGRDIQEFIEKVTYCLNNPDICKEYGNNLRNFIVTKRSWNAVKDPLLRALSKNCD